MRASRFVCLLIQLICLFISSSSILDVYYKDVTSSQHREVAAARFGDMPLAAGPEGALWVLGESFIQAAAFRCLVASSCDTSPYWSTLLRMTPKLM